MQRFGKDHPKRESPSPRLQRRRSISHCRCMPSLTASRLLSSTLTPFLYPCLDSTWIAQTAILRNVARNNQSRRRLLIHKRCQSTTAVEFQPEFPAVDVNPSPTVAHLPSMPAPEGTAASPSCERSTSLTALLTEEMAVPGAMCTFKL